MLVSRLAAVAPVAVAIVVVATLSAAATSGPLA